MSKLLGVAAILSLLIGCVPKGGWVDIEGKPYKFEKGAIYTIGVAGPEDAENEFLRREVAGNRAAAEMLKNMDRYIAYLMKDYVGPEGAHIERAIKTFAAGHITGARIIAWREGRGGKIEALCKLDLKTLKDHIELQQELSREARDYIKKRANEFFKELEKEEEKRGLR